MPQLGSPMGLGLEYKTSNFSAAFLFLSRDQKEALKAIYSFCREVDDIVDQKRPGAAGILQAWEDFVNGRGDAPRPELGACLSEAVQKYGIARPYLVEIIGGVRMDLHQSRYETFEQLKKYCYGVASAVGLCCLPIFGVPVAEGTEYAVNLGLSFQLTNIIRDVATDADRGRIYLPLEDLRGFHYTEGELLSKVYNRHFVDLLQLQAQRARNFYQCAERSLPSSWRRQLLPARVMAAVYGKILDKIEKTGFRVFDGKIRLSAFSKWVAVVQEVLS